MPTRTSRLDAARAAALLALSALAAFQLAACGEKKPGDGSAPAASGGAPGAQRMLNISQGSDVLSLDPYFKNETPTFAVMGNIFSPLTDVSAELKLVPALAESWTAVNPLLWEFKLRQGVKFHNGSAFDAEDVRYSILRARDWPPSRQRAEVATIKEVAVVDPHTVRFEMRMPDAVLPNRLISIFILDRETCEPMIAAHGDSWLATNPVGTGPYKLEEWKKDAYCRLAANENFWGGKPPVEKLNFIATSNDATRLASFLNGQIDILAHVPVRDVERVKNVPGYRLLASPGLRLIYLGLDVGRDQSPGVPASPPNPLKDLRVRQAIYHAINIDLIIEKVMNGYAKPAGQLFPEEVFGFDPSVTRAPHDIEKAKALLAEAGFADGFEIRLDAPNDRYVNDAQIAQAIASELAKVNIRVNVNAMPKARFFPEEERGDFSFFLIGWTNPNGDGYGTFDHLLHTQVNDFGGANTSTKYSNPELDRLCEASAAEFDPAKRLLLLQQEVRIAMQDLPHIPLHFQMDLYAVSDRIEWNPRRDTQVKGIEVKWK